jgi:cytochrome c551/c552
VLFGYTEKLVTGIAAAGGDSVQPFPLYRQPALTDEERDAIREAVGAYNDNDDDEECAKIAATLHGLLKRLG